MKAAEEVLGREISFTKFWTLMLNLNVFRKQTVLAKLLNITKSFILFAFKIEVEIVGILALTILQKFN